MEGLRIFAYNGWIVHHPNPLTDSRFNDRGAEGWNKVEFAGRRPILADVDNRKIYLGMPNWFHHDVGGHFNVDEYDHRQGFFEGGPDWGGGDLRWYGHPDGNDQHKDVAHALLESGFDIPNAEGDNAEESGLDDIPEDAWENVD